MKKEIISTDAVQPVKTKRKKKGRWILLVVLVLAVLAAAYFIWQVFREEELPAVTGTLSSGSLSKSVSGTGVTVAADSVTYSLPSMEAAVTGWYVEAGDMVEEGQLLFEQDDADVDEKIADLREEISDYEEQISDYQANITDYELSIQDLREDLSEAREAMENLTVTADFDGQITGVTVSEDDDVNANRVLAVLTDVNNITLTQYFSYNYENDIAVGMTANISIPSRMLTLTGIVTDIKKVDYMTAEGMRCFAVTVTMKNPGALVSGLAAQLWFSPEDGSEIFPASENDTLHYAQSRNVISQVNGTIEEVCVADYQKVCAGEVLFKIDSTVYETQIENLQKQIENYERQISNAKKQLESLQTRIKNTEESIADTEETREEYKRYSEIEGKVVSASYETMRNGWVNGSVSIYNLESVTISVNFDELDVDQLSVGQKVNVYRSTSTTTETYDAEITYISLEASNSNGVATFAGTITIHSNWELSAGVNVSYSVDVGDTEEGVLAPVNALRSYEDGYYLLVRRDSIPENALAVEEEYPEGFYAVPVEVGNSNSSYVYILSGAEEGDTVFLRYRQSAPSGGDSTSTSGETDASEFSGFPGGDFPSGDFPSGNFGGFSGGGSGGFSGGSMPGGGSGSRTGGFGG